MMITATVVATTRNVEPLAETLVTNRQPARWALAVKRAGDVVFSAVLLLLLSPLLLIVAVAVKTTSRGPIIFKQERVGKGGKLFVMWKFRSMAVDTTDRINADPELRRIYEENDFKLPANVGFITPIGRLIRKTSIDELPQLLHVLTGKMSMVGVRPIEMEQLALRDDEARQAYESMSPGLTGKWQVAGRSTITQVGRLELDRSYSAEWSLKSDLAIVLRTPFALMRLRDTQ
jgi:lipopolysaccharide/colanic/teichoic acid biosynthesis glycosyltransferase